MLAVIIGALAATLSVTSFVPQAVRIIKTHDTKGLSTAMWTLNTAAFALWTTYGVFLGNFPIIVPNVICFCLAGFILAMKILPRRKRDAVLDKIASVASH